MTSFLYEKTHDNNIDNNNNQDNNSNSNSSNESESSKYNIDEEEDDDNIEKGKEPSIIRTIINKKKKRLFSLPIPTFLYSLFKKRKWGRWLAIQCGLFAINFLQNEVVSFIS